MNLTKEVSFGNPSYNVLTVFLQYSTRQQVKALTVKSKCNLHVAKCVVKFKNLVCSMLQMPVLRVNLKIHAACNRFGCHFAGLERSG